MNERTDWVTTSLLELLIAAKNIKFHKIVKNYQILKKRSMHTLTHTRRKRTRVHDKTCRHKFTLRVCVCLHGSSFKKSSNSLLSYEILYFFYYLIKLSFKFHKDRSFGNWDISKKKLTLVQPFIFYVIYKFSKFDQ